MSKYQVNFKNYLFQIEELDGNKVNISASNSIEGELYEIVDYQLSKIQSKCLGPALQEKQPQTLMAHLSFNDNGALVLEVIVKYDFIPEMREEIAITKKQVDGKEKLRLLLKQAQKNLFDLSEKFRSAKESKKVVLCKETKTFNSNKKTALLELNLAPGDYEVSFSFFVKPDSTFVDLQFYVGSTKTDFIPQSGFHLNKNQGSNFYPITVKAVVQLNDASQVSVVTQGSNSGTFQAKEMVLMAEKITHLEIKNN